MEILKLRDFKDYAADPCIAATVTDLLELESKANETFAEEFTGLLDEPVAVYRGVPRLQLRDDTWYPFWHDLRLENQAADHEFLSSVLALVTDEQILNLYGMPEYVEDLLDQSHRPAVLKTERHVFERRHPDIRLNLTSKQRNAIASSRASADCYLSEVSGDAGADQIIKLLPLIQASWLMKPNTDGLENTVMEVCSWLWTVHKLRENKARMLVATNGGQRVGMLSFVKKPPDIKVACDGQSAKGYEPVEWVFQSFWQLPFVTSLNSDYDPSKPLGSLMLEEALSRFLNQTDCVHLTAPSFMGDHVWPYEAYKRKFSNCRITCCSIYGTGGEGYAPYINLATGEVIV